MLAMVPVLPFWLILLLYPVMASFYDSSEWRASSGRRLSPAEW